MKTIYKYPLEITGEQILYIPFLSQILHAGLDADKKLCLWAMVDTSNETRPIIIKIYGTGNPVGDMAFTKHLGTCTQDEFVWHIFQAL